LAEGELPRSDQEGENKADKEIVEKFQSIADDGGDEYLDLIPGETRTSIEHVEHCVSPWRIFIF
jgi:hypothetical protein